MKKLRKNIIVLIIISLIVVKTSLPVLGTEENNEINEDTIENVTTADNQDEYLDYEKTGKEENVYVNLKNDGSIKDVYVVNEILLNEPGDITDYGNYLDVRNLSNSEDIINNNGTINLKGQKGKNFYQGKLDTENIPWNISVKYYLNEVETLPEDIVGKSGKIEIKINITKNPNVNETFFENFLLQTTLSLNTDICKNIETEGATIANNGDDKQLTYMVLAGEEKEISIKFDSTKFELQSGISFNGVLMSLVIDSLDTTEITNKVNELKDAVSTLNNGANNLKSGSNEFKSGINRLASSSSGLTGGSSAVKNGINTSLNGVRSIRANLTTSINSQNNNSDAVKAQIMEQISSTLATEPYASIIAANPEMLPILQNLLEQTVSGTINTVSNAYETQINSTMTELGSALSNLENGLATLASSYDSIDSGINTVVASINTLNNSYTGIDNGINQISNGTSQMNNETQNLDSNVETTIDEMLERFKNSDYQVISFVSEQNTNVNSVQFVIKTEGIKIEEEEKIEEEDEKEVSFGEKFVNLFKKEK